MTGVNSYNNYTPTSAIGNIHLYIILLMFFAFHLISRVVLRSFDQPWSYLLHIPILYRCLPERRVAGECTYQREELRGRAVPDVPVDHLFHGVHKSRGHGAGNVSELLCQLKRESTTLYTHKHEVSEAEFNASLYISKPHVSSVLLGVWFYSSSSLFLALDLIVLWLLLEPMEEISL